MKKNILFLLVLSLLLSISAKAESNTNTNLVKELIVKLKMLEMMDNLPEQLATQAIQSENSVEDKGIEQKLNELVKKSYSRSRAEKELMAYIQSTINVNELTQILEWINADLGSRILKEEQLAANPEEQVKLNNYVARLNGIPPDQDRAHIINRFVKESQIVEVMDSFTKELTKNLIIGRNAVVPKETKMKEEELDRLLKSIADENNSQSNFEMESFLNMSSFYTYRKFTNEEMNTYIEFLKGDAGKKYVELTIVGAIVFGKMLRAEVEAISKE